MCALVTGVQTCALPIYQFPISSGKGLKLRLSPPGGCRAAMACGSVAAPGRPAPHEVMRFTLAREELREDRTGEGRVVELDRAIGAVVRGGFRARKSVG